MGKLQWTTYALYALMTNSAFLLLVSFNIFVLYLVPQKVEASNAHIRLILNPFPLKALLFFMSIFSMVPFYIYLAMKSATQLENTWREWILKKALSVLASHQVSYLPI